MADILAVCLGESTKTRIVHSTNLNFNNVDPYINFLMSNGFITILEGTPKKYKTTDKGRELLGKIKEIHEFL